MTKPSVPTCLAIVGDGNRRYAKTRGKETTWGHVQGFGRNLLRIERAAFAYGVRHVVFYLASEKNFGRDDEEVANFCEIVKRHLRHRFSLHDGTRVHVCGVWERFWEDPEIRKLSTRIEDRTRAFSKKHVTLCLAYDGRTEIIEAVKACARESNCGEGLTGTSFEKYLWTSHIPDVDFLIRTGCDGDPHNSGSFLMWKTPDTQLYFTEKPWPAFTPADLKEALVDYSRRHRRLGK